MDRLSELRNRMRVAATLCTACCVLALTACSDDTTGDDSRLPDGEYPMTFTAAVEGLTVTRAGTANGEWTDADWIAVQVSDAESGNDEIKIYAPSKIDGNSATLTSDDPFYWQRNNETKTVSAWYCGDGSTASGKANAGKVPTSWSVQPDQNEGEGYQQSDFLYAAPKDISFSSTDKSLAFTHQTARVVINIKKAEAAMEADVISSVVIGYENNLALSGTYTAPTEGNATDTWNTSGGTMGTITPKDITPTSGSSDILKTYAALVIPQNMSEQKFIAVSLRDGNTYYYTPQGTDAYLESGTQYTYNITVKHDRLEVVTAGTNVEWGIGKTETVTSRIVAKSFTAGNLKNGDYYYSDGETSDGGLRKIYTDGSTEMLDIAPVLTGQNGSERTCIGIVYWVGDIRDDNYGLLNSKFPDGMHGLVVSLWDMRDPDSEKLKMLWTYGYSDKFVNDWLVNARLLDGNPRPEDFKSIQVTDKMQGYANTIALKEYNKYVEGKDGDGYGKDGNKRVKPVKGLDDFQRSHPSPSNSSGWYWPSIEELKYVCWGQGATKKGISGMEMLNTQIEKVSGELIKKTYYWSSTEGSTSSGFYAGDVYFKGGDVSKSSCKFEREFQVRPLLAF